MLNCAPELDINELLSGFGFSVRHIQNGPSVNKALGMLRTTLRGFPLFKNSLAGLIFTFSILSPGERVPSLFRNAPTSYSPGSDDPRTACVRTTMRDPMPGETFFALGFRFSEAARRAGNRMRFMAFFASKS